MKKHILVTTFFIFSSSLLFYHIKVSIGDNNIVNLTELGRDEIENNIRLIEKFINSEDAPLSDEVERTFFTSENDLEQYFLECNCIKKGYLNGFLEEPCMALLKKMKLHSNSGKLESMLFSYLRSPIGPIFTMHDKSRKVKFIIKYPFDNNNDFIYDESGKYRYVVDCIILVNKNRRINCTILMTKYKEYLTSLGVFQNMYINGKSIAITYGNQDCRKFSDFFPGYCSKSELREYSE